MKVQKTFLALSVIGALGSAVPGYAADTSLKTEDQKFSYVMGVQFARSIERQGINNVDVKILNQAISDVLTGAKLKLSEEEMHEAYNAKVKKLQAERDVKAQKAKEEGEKFLAVNKKKPGVTTLESGVQYKIIKAGSGAKPTLDDTVTVNYRGTLIDGSEFDSSYKREKPITFPVKGVIEGWRQVLPLMSVGSKWQVFIPAEYGYGEQGAGGKIGPNSTLIFEIELLGIEPKKAD